MITFKEPLTEEQISVLNMGVIEQIQYKAWLSNQDEELLPIIDKIEWNNRIDSLKYIYYLMIKRSSGYYSEVNEEIKRRLDSLLENETREEYIKSIDERLKTATGLVFMYL